MISHHPTTFSATPTRHAAFLPGRFIVTGGTASDYRQLARFHYLGPRPATFAAIVAVRYWPDDDADRLVGVAVLSWPSALNQARHRVFGLKPLRFGQRLRWVNANLRCVSRVIVHPQFRGLGVSTRLIAAAVNRCDTPFVEAVARMGHAHPLFDSAGFARVRPALAEGPMYFWRRTTADSS